jgi:peptide/nickel transport system substrate-binding protein
VAPPGFFYVTFYREKFNATALAVVVCFGFVLGMRVFVLVFLALALAPCWAEAGAKDCGVVVVPPGLGIGPGADVTSFNPLLVDSTYNQEASWLLFEQLLWINRYHQVDFSRSVASSVSTPDAGKSYDVTLRRWEWSDGVPVTAADVVYTLKLIRAFGTAYTQYGAGGMPDIVAGIEVHDPLHFTVVLKHRVNPDWFILNGLYQLMPLPAHVWGKLSADEVWQGQSDPAFFSVVDGPLEIKKLNVGVDAEFAPNPSYGGAAMNFSRFVMKFYNAEGQELQAAESGDLDMANVPFDLFDQVKGVPGVYMVTLPPTYSWHELVPNMGNHATPYFGDVRVRDAMADAIDQGQIIELAMHGHGVKDLGPVPVYPGTFLSPAAKAGDYGVGYDPARARDLLAAAGFRPGADGVVEKDGRRLAFTLAIPADQPLRTEMAEVIQQNFAAVGIEMRVHQEEFNKLLTDMVNRPQAWEAILIAQDQNYYPSGEGSFKTGAYYNNNGYSDPKMDRLIDESTDEPGLDGLFAYEDYGAAQQPVIFLPNEQYSVLVRNGMHGAGDFMNPLGNWAPEKIYCDTAR